MTQQPRRARALASGVALLQVALLLASVIMVPASVIAQEPSAPGSQQGSEPSVEPDPEPSAPPSSADPAVTPTAPDSPSGPESNRVTLVAAADIDGNGALDDPVTIESPAGTILQNVRAVPVPTDPPPPPGITFPAGLFEYEVVVAKPGDPAAVTFHLPDGTVSQEVDTGFWVLQNGRWSDLTARSNADHVTDEVTVTLVDGGAGDEDLRADGTIDDPGGPGVPGEEWSLTITIHAPEDPTAIFNIFVEECDEPPGAAPCTPQDPRQWVDWVADDGPTLPTAEITPRPLTHGQSFTWANLDAGQHYRVIEVGTASAPLAGTGSPPPGWAITSFECESVGATIFDTDDNSFVGFLDNVTAENETTPGWAACTVTNHQPLGARTGSTITARKWGDRVAEESNAPLPGATMGIWRDDGDGNFEPGIPPGPGGGDGNATGTCVTGAAGTCNFTGLAQGGYWVMEVAPPIGDTWNPILEWGPGSYIVANPAVPYAAHRNGDPAADLTVSGPDLENGHPIFVSGSATETKTTDFFANRRTNPSIVDVTCQALLRIVLVLDRSGSINDNGPDAYENAVLGFVSDLVGTNTEVAIASFAASSSLNLGYTSVLGGPSAALNGAIASVYNNLGGGTNWDAGLFEVDDIATAPDLVVMVTDGNPTLNNTTDTSSGEVNWHDFTQAVTSANLLKSNDSRVITVAAGAAGTISIPGLIGISGPLTNQASALDDDYIIGTPDELAEALREIALARCGASLDIEKQSVGGTGTFDFSGSGAGLPATFTRNTAGANPTASIPFTFTAPQFGTKYVQETPETGWTLTSIACTPNGADIIIGTGSGAGFAAPGGAGFNPGDTTVQAVITASDTPTCTFTNSQASLDIEKQSVGGTGTFDFSGSGAGLPATFTRNTAGANPTASIPFTFTAPQFGTKYVQETPETGWTLTSIACTPNGADIIIGTGSGAGFAAPGGAGFNPGDTTVQAVIDAGDTPTCLFTNTADATITVTKDAVPDADQLFAFTTTGSGGGSLFAGGAFFLDDYAPSGTANTLTFTFTGADATGTKTIQETLPVPGWSLTDLVCSKGTTTLATGLASIDLLPGDEVTCTYTNTQVPVELIIQKVVVNDHGGTATVDDFGITTSAGDLLFGAAVEDPADTFTYTAETLLVAAGEYDLAELEVAGYEPSDWTCSNGDGGAFDDGSVTVAVGDPTVTCSITNDDQPVELIIQKVVVNDHGGTATVDDFGITTSAGDLLFGAAVEDPADTFTYTAETLLVAAGEYDLAELEVAGYEPSDWTCSNGDGGAFDDGSVTVAVGDPTVTCSITNDDQPVELIIQKVVVNDHGGTATVDDFGITTSAGDLLFGAAVEDPADTFTYTAETLLVAAGEYDLAELEVAGYEPSDWTCSNGDGGAFDDGSVTVAVGDPTVTCSITNDDQPVELIIQKVVVNDHGGTATVDDFGITTSAGDLLFGAAVEDPADTFTYTAETLLVAAGEYDLAELEVAGYEPSDWTCSNGDGGAFDDGSVTVAVGDPTVTCSITNDDQPVELIIQKVVVNDHGGTATVDDFGITTSAGDLLFGAAVEDPADTFTYTAETLLVAAGEYDLAELEVAGYEPSDWTCSNGDGGAFDDGSVTVAVGDPTVTCSITNDDQPVELISLEVLKVADDHLIPAAGQDVTFTFTVTNTSEVPVEITSLEDDVFGPLTGDADCQVGTILPAGGSCSFEESFLVASDVDPNDDGVFPPHVNTVTACATLPAGAQAAAGDEGTAGILGVDPAAPACDEDPETIEFITDDGVLPDSGELPDTANGQSAPSPATGLLVALGIFLVTAAHRLRVANRLRLGVRRYSP